MQSKNNHIHTIVLGSLDTPPFDSISALSLVVEYLVPQVLLLRAIPVGVGGIEPKILVEL